MAILMSEGFDNIAIGDLTSKWAFSGTTSGNSMTTGLLGTGQALVLNGNTGPRRAFSASNVATVYVGARIKFGAVTSTQFFTLLDASGNQVAGMDINAGVIRFYRGGSVASSAGIVVASGGTIAINSTNYIEVGVTLATGATGSVTIKVNGAAVATVSSVQTANTTAGAAAIGFGANAAQSVTVDDVYVVDTSGSTHTTFLGDTAITTVYPSGAGRLSQWPTQVGGTGGSPYTAVNDSTPNGDTSYIADTTVGDVHDFALSSAGSPTSVLGVSVYAWARKDDTAAHSLGIGVGNGTTENFDAGTALGTAYVSLSRTLDTNPLTSAAWTVADLSTLQAAVKVIS